jgi:hypothetical protein
MAVLRLSRESTVFRKLRPATGGGGNHDQVVAFVYSIHTRHHLIMETGERRAIRVSRHGNAPHDVTSAPRDVLQTLLTLEHLQGRGNAKSFGGLMTT